VGEEAFAEAKAPRRRFAQRRLLDLPLCHVMEEESFEDLEIAEYLNRDMSRFKVDSEERPDIDTLYMAAVQMVSGVAAGR